MDPTIRLPAAWLFAVSGRTKSNSTDLHVALYLRHWLSCKTPRGMRVTKLAAVTGLNRSTVIKSLKRAVDRGWIVRHTARLGHVSEYSLVLS